MSSLVNKVLNFVGWETEDEEEFEEIEEQEEVKDEIERPQFMQSLNRKTQNKIVNIHSTSQFKVVVLQPEKFEDAKDVCDHLKNKKPIVVNLSSVQKELAQRIVDFLSGSVYGLDGNIQKVSNDIFIVAPHNVDIMSHVKEDIVSKTTFPWCK